MRKLCLLFAMCLCLSGCQKAEKTETILSETVPLSSENIYRDIPLTFPDTADLPQTDNIRWVGFLPAEADSFWIKTVSGDLTDPWILYLRYDLDGGYLEAVTAPEMHLDKLLYTRSEYIYPDGGILFVFDNVLYRTAPDGTVLAETEIVMDSNSYPRIDCGEETIAVSHGDSVALFDNHLTMLQSWPCPVDIQDLQWGTDGMLYVQNILGQVECMDPATGDSVSCIPDGTGGYQYFGTEDFLYCSDHDGVWQVNRNEAGQFSIENRILLLNWTGSSLVESKTSIKYIPDPDTMLAFSANNLDNREIPVILKRNTAPETTDVMAEPVREVVIQGWYDAQTTALLESLAADFNKSQETYTVRLEILDFLKYRDPVAFQNLLRENGMPDLMVFGESEESLFRNLREQGYLADLTAYSKELTGSACAAVMEGKNCFRLPLFIRYNTMVTAGATEMLTMETLLSERETLADKEALFSSPYMIKYLTDCIQTAFVDFSDGKCDFDTDLFREYLMLLAELDECLNTSAGYMIGAGMTHPKLPDRLKNNELRYLVFPIESVDSLGRLKLIFGEEAYSVCGFPDVTVLPEVVLSFSVPESEKNREGAGTFLDYILSETVQTSDVITREHFPVTSDGVENVLKNTWFYYNIYGSTNSQGVFVQNIYCLERRSDRKPVEYDAAGNAMIFGKDVKEVSYTEKDISLLRELLEDGSGGHITDPTVAEILNEEISAYLSGDRTIDDTIRILQSRVGTYLAE